MKPFASRCDYSLQCYSRFYEQKVKKYNLLLSTALSYIFIHSEHVFYNILNNIQLSKSTQNSNNKKQDDPSFLQGH